MDLSPTALDLTKDLERVLDMKAAVQRNLILEEGRLDVLAGVIGYDVLDFHALLIHLLKRARAGGKFWRLWLAPRGSGKSTIVTVSDCIHQILQDKNVRILIGSRTSEQAEGILNAIKGGLKTQRFCELFGDLQGEQWDKSKITVNTREKEFMEPTVMALGAGGAVASKHFDMIKADDLVDEENARTEGERKKIWTFVYKTMIPTLLMRRSNGEPGEFDAVGTRYDPLDIYNYFEQTDSNFKGSTFKIPALVNPETGEPDVSGVSICEKYLPAAALKQRRTTTPSVHFDSQMQQSTSLMIEGDIFKPKNFRHYEEVPQDLVKAHGLMVWAAQDLAIAEMKEHDEYADYVIGIDIKGKQGIRIYLLDNFHGRIPYSQQMARVEYIFDTWDPVRLGIEANAFQKARLGSVYRELGDVIGDRCVPMMTLKSKVTRAWKLNAHYENGRIFHRAHAEEDLERQLLTFPNGPNDDMFDALDLAVTLGTVLGAKKKRKERVGVFGAKRPSRSLI